MGTIPMQNDSQVPYSLENSNAPLNTPAGPITTSHLSSPGNPSSSNEDELSSDEIHTCDKCGKKYSKPHRLRKHYRNHQPFLVCPHDVCEKKCAEKKDLDRHIRAHHGPWAKKNPKLANLSAPEAEYRCKICGYTTSRKDNLKRHTDKGTCQRRK